MVRKLRTIYSHPNDVDLIVGGMAERPVDDAMVGPTFRCLIYEQFSRSRRTDRFFYDSAMQPHPFTSGRLNIIYHIILYIVNIFYITYFKATFSLIKLFRYNRAVDSTA